MGVPTFFRWLSRKYPKIVVDVVEEEWNELPNGERIPPDTSRPNPNGIEFDCLYLDMNGIIHPCFHPENKPQPESEEEILNAIYEYIDRLFAIVRPRRLLYLAIDGVAPRAKMNQQRSRRFRAVKEALQKAEDEEIVRQDLVARGLLTPQEAQAQRERAARRLDSNIITPGTAFMDHVAQGLRGYIQRRLTSDPGWRGLTVILSDASVPGEGEHKIMQFIRRQRHQPGYDPNTRHVLYGLDADLIMLALATHEPHFHILREVVLMNTTTNCHRCGLPGHHAFECMTVLTAPRNSTLASAPTSQPVAREKRVPYQFLRVNVLREYLAKDLFVETPFPYSFERCLDDYVFLCFFVGNDFLPHLPTLEIREGAIDLLVDLYKKILPSLGGYLTQDGDVCLDRVQVLLQALAPLEEGILRRRREREKEAREQQRQLAGDKRHVASTPMHTSSAPPLTSPSSSTSSAPPLTSPSSSTSSAPPLTSPSSSTSSAPPLTSPSSSTSSAPPLTSPSSSTLSAPPLTTTSLLPLSTPSTPPTASSFGIGTTSPRPPPSASRMLSACSASYLQESSATQPPIAENHTNPPFSSASSSLTPSSSNKEAAQALRAALISSAHTDGTIEEADEEEEDDDKDVLRLGEEGWQARYYAIKFGVKYDDVAFFAQLRQAYIQGLVWVQRYYYQGVASWKWFYPYHYAPFTGELVRDGLAARVDLAKVYEVSEPFRPFEQLLGVLPAPSAHCLPPAFRRLMEDPNSPLAEFYPKDFVIDLNGKRYAWQGVVLLPFIDEERLLEAVAGLEATLTEEEQRRNTPGTDLIFVHHVHPLADTLRSLYMPSSASSSISSSISSSTSSSISSSASLSTSSSSSSSASSSTSSSSSSSTPTSTSSSASSSTSSSISSSTPTSTSSSASSSSSSSASSSNKKLVLPLLPRGGLAGSVELDPFQERLQGTSVWCARYFLPPLPPQYERPLRREELNIAPDTPPVKLPSTVPQAPACLLPGVILPPPQLRDSDWYSYSRPHGYEFGAGHDLRHSFMGNSLLPPLATRPHERYSRPTYDRPRYHPDNHYHPYSHSYARSSSHRVGSERDERERIDTTSRHPIYPYCRRPQPLEQQRHSHFAKTEPSASGPPSLYGQSHTVPSSPFPMIPTLPNVPTSRKVPTPSIPTPLPPVSPSPIASPSSVLPSSVSPLLSLLAPYLPSLLPTNNVPSDNRVYSPHSQPKQPDQVHVPTQPQAKPPPLQLQPPRGGYQPPYASNVARGGHYPHPLSSAANTSSYQLSSPRHSGSNQPTGPPQQRHSQAKPQAKHEYGRPSSYRFNPY